jgi:hypothetical protein
MVKRIEIDAGLGIEYDGKIELYVYIGEGSCEPVLEESESLESLIDNLLQAYMIPGEEKIASYHLSECEALVKSLKAATKYAKKRIKELS